MCFGTQSNGSYIQVIKIPPNCSQNYLVHFLKKQTIFYNFVQCALNRTHIAVNVNI